eukprot:scaffold112375_cov69-Phaeocystis_antarctica.AAC.5
MVSHTTRLVCYAIPLCPGPSYLYLSIYLSVITRLVTWLSPSLSLSGFRLKPRNEDGVPGCKFRRPDPRGADTRSTRTDNRSSKPTTTFEGKPHTHALNPAPS